MTLVALHREIDSRTQEIVRAHAALSHKDWPCRQGCDRCCRHLAEMPRLSRDEWEFLEQGLGLLSDHLRQKIVSRILNLQATETVCPFLEQGSCLVYYHRPIACRTYGFYVERDRGLFCGQIEERLDSGELADVVWGNAAGVEARLSAAAGEKISLKQYFTNPV